MRSAAFAFLSLKSRREKGPKIKSPGSHPGLELPVGTPSVKNNYSRAQV
jgi:hypothetical protein